MSLRLLTLSAVWALSLAQTVTITRDIPSSGHRCVRHCLFRPYNAGTDLGDALECGPPYEEDCYCPTAAPRAEIVSRHIDECASESCSAGDVTLDIESMRRYYAGYCVENGYTADLVQEWYSSAEETSTTEATTQSTSETSTTTEAEGTGTSTSSDVVTETGVDKEGDSKTEDDGRNPDGLPDMNLDGEGAASGLAVPGVGRGILIFGLVSLPIVTFAW